MMWRKKYIHIYIHIPVLANNWNAIYLYHSSSRLAITLIVCCQNSQSWDLGFFAKILSALCQLSAKHRLKCCLLKIMVSIFIFAVKLDMSLIFGLLPILLIWWPQTKHQLRICVRVCQWHWILVFVL